MLHGRCLRLCMPARLVRIQESYGLEAAKEGQLALPSKAWRAGLSQG